MGERIKLGLTYTYNENWIGGTYYVENLVRSLGMIEPDKQPFLVILITTKEDKKRFLENITYPYLKFVFYDKKMSSWMQKVNNLYHKITHKNLIDLRITDDDVDVVYPLRKDEYLFERVTHKIFWIPDLQEKRLPQFFSQNEIKMRDERIKVMIGLKKPIVFSSYAAKTDFEQFYKAQASLHVVHFAVHHPIIVESNNILEKYNISKPYFIVCNQFWKHKNHMVVVDALASIESEIPFEVVFTGKGGDYRHKNYFQELKNYIKDKGLENIINITGFIEREDQLALMKSSIAVIQPSFFEGWSTVVEDAKALGKPVILSDLEVHKEQMPDSKYFFNPNSAEQLATYLFNFEQQIKFQSNNERYKANQLEFAEEFLKVITN